MPSESLLIGSQYGTEGDYWLNEFYQSREADLNQPTFLLSRSAETRRSPAWSSSLLGLDSSGRLCGADPRFPRHSIYRLA